VIKMGEGVRVKGGTEKESDYQKGIERPKREIRKNESEGGTRPAKSPLPTVGESVSGNP